MLNLILFLYKTFNDVHINVWMIATLRFSSSLQWRSKLSLQNAVLNHARQVKMRTLSSVHKSKESVHALIYRLRLRAYITARTR